MTNPNVLRQLDADAEILSARCVGLTQQVRIMVSEVRDMAKAVVELSDNLVELRYELRKEAET